jgi:hypothetical protein
MRPACRRPVGCQAVVVTADAANAWQANMALIQALGYGYVLALPRTWKFANGKAVKARVTHLPRWKYTQMRIPTVNIRHRRTLWVYVTRARLRHWGDVTVVLSQRRRNDGPKQTNILVTNLPESVTAREIVGVYLRRWWVEMDMPHYAALGRRGMGPTSQGPINRVLSWRGQGSAPWFPKNLYTRGRVLLGLPPGGDPFDHRARPELALVALQPPYRLC